jgi:hypothetical protein
MNNIKCKEEHNMTDQILRLDYIGDPQPIFCPVCGKGIQGKKIEGPSCEHVCFLYFDDVGEFSDVKSTYQDQAQEVSAKCEASDDYPPNVLFESIMKDSMYLLNVTSRGKGCGPMETTWAVGIDMCP